MGGFFSLDAKHIHINDNAPLELAISPTGHRSKFLRVRFENEERINLADKDVVIRVKVVEG